VLRGPQFGYNQCGAANATATANCQTLVVNNAVSAFFSIQSTICLTKNKI
jgi:hypothetical protein